MRRRSFLKIAGGVATGYALGAEPVLAAGKPARAKSEEKVNGLPRRVLGRTGQKVSVICFPGLALSNYDAEQCNAGVVKAFELGINYFDVAPAYGKDGDCEKKMGVALQALDRSKIFLACKTKMRDAEGARMELERSLERLKTDHFDLYQLHHIRTPDEVATALGPGGAMETILKAKEQGKIRFIGFSAHTTKGSLAALDGFSFDSVMFPINFVEYYKIGFGKAVIERAGEKGAAVIGMKTLSKGPWPEGVERTRKWWYRPTESQEEVSAAVRFTLSQNGVAAAVPPSWLDLVEKAIEAGKTYRRITKKETQQLQETAKSCLSLFQKQEEAVARGEMPHEPFYPDCPHECCGGMHA